MIARVNQANLADYLTACTYEHVFGAKARTALTAYGEEGAFFVQTDENGPTAALYILDHVLVIAANERSNAAEVADLIRKEGVTETDTNWEQCAALQKLLGGVTESSYYMEYLGKTVEAPQAELQPGDLRAVFGVLQRSHEYYRTHFQFETWAGDLARKLDAGLMELYQLEVDGEVIGTGSIGAEDDECGVVVAVAVVPEYRHRGLGAAISAALTARILEKGKTPRLISGYDEVAALYKLIGYTTCGRWGELYL